MKIEELEADLKQGNLQSIYLLYGEETFLLETSLKRIKNNFGELTKGINYILLDETNIQNVITDIETPAFGYNKKLIIAKNTNLFKKAKKSSTAKDNDFESKLAKYINENIELIKESVVLLFIEETAEKNKLFEAIDKNGVVCNFERLKPMQIVKRLKAICNAYKVDVTEQNLQLLIEYCGTNMQDLINEIRKLIEYAGNGGKIEKEDIEVLAIKQIDAIIFDLTDNLGKKDIKKAIDVLDGLIYNKEPIQKILITLYNHFKKLYIVKLAARYNKDLAQSMNLKPNQMFLTTKYKKQAEYFEEVELRKIIAELINLDKNYKIGQIDLNIGLKSILCNYCSE